MPPLCPIKVDMTPTMHEMATAVYAAFKELGVDWLPNYRLDTTYGWNVTDPDRGEFAVEIQNNVRSLTLLVKTPTKVNFKDEQFCTTSKSEYRLVLESSVHPRNYELTTLVTSFLGQYL